MTHSVASEQQDGLSWTFVVELDEKNVIKHTSTKLQELAPKVSLPGFRPGKIPDAVLKQRWGERVRIESIQELASQASDSVLKDKNIRAVTQPDILDLTGLKEGQVSFSLRVDAFPEIDHEKIKSLSIDRYDPIVSDSDVEEALTKIAVNSERTQAVETPRLSQKDDTLVVNFTGTIDGKEFKNNAAKGAKIKLGGGNYLQEMEDQLLNRNVGDNPTITLTFPESYSARDLAGKKAQFAVEILEHHESKSSKVDDELAKKLGLGSVDELRKNITETLAKRYADLEHQIAHRRLLDILDVGMSFDIPKRLVEKEFDVIWKQLEKAQQEGTLNEEEKNKDTETLRSEFQVIAERRVRLGLLLADIGRVHKLEASEQDITQAVVREAQRYPGQEQQVFELYSKNKQLRSQLSAPILETKAISKILDDIPTKRTPISIDDLTKVQDELQKGSEEEKTSKKSKSKADVSKKKKPAGRGVKPNKTSTGTDIAE